MTEAESRACGLNPMETRMGLRYGVNEADSWWHFALGPQREERVFTRLILQIFMLVRQQ